MSKVYKVKLHEAYARVEWCKKTFGTQVKGGNWWRHKGHLYFKDEKCYTWYKLMWSQDENVLQN